MSSNPAARPTFEMLKALRWLADNGVVITWWGSAGIYCATWTANWTGRAARGEAQSRHFQAVVLEIRKQAERVLNPAGTPAPVADFLDEMDAAAESPSDDEAQAFMERLEEMVGDSRFDWALDTIGGILETVRSSRRVSDRQREAINNIESAVERRENR